MILKLPSWESSPAGRERLAALSRLPEAWAALKGASGRTVVVKLGGPVLEEPERVESVAEEIACLARCGAKVVVVHGGSAQYGRLLKRLAIKPPEGADFAPSSRALKAARMVFAGSLNTALVDALCRQGLKAVGATASGLKGDFIASMIGQGIIPVIAPLAAPGVAGAAVPHPLRTGSGVAAGGAGEAVPMDADSLAVHVAAGLRAASLFLLTGALKEMAEENLREKERACREAEARGVSRAHVLDGTRQGAIFMSLIDERKP